MYVSLNSVCRITGSYEKILLDIYFSVVSWMTILLFLTFVGLPWPSLPVFHLSKQPESCSHR